MKASELKKAIDEALADLPEGTDPHILVVDENGFSSELDKVRLESWAVWKFGEPERVRNDYIMYLEVE